MRPLIPLNEYKYSIITSLKYLLSIDFNGNQFNEHDKKYKNALCQRAKSKL